MIKRLTSILLMLALSLALALPALAEEAPTVEAPPAEAVASVDQLPEAEEPAAPQAPAQVTLNGEVRATVGVTLNGAPSALPAVVYGGTSYVPFYAAVLALRPDAQVTWENGSFIATAADFTMTVRAGDVYLVINERYLYIPDGVKSEPDGAAWVPARTLATGLGAWIGWSGTVDLCSGGLPLTAEGKPYDDVTLDLLAKVIQHESGYQPFEGKLAVGAVILNRVNSSRFPNTVYGVIFQPNQFPGATNATPSENSVLAARLCLEGANVAPTAYYFNGVGKDCWAARNKALITVIGGHAFYG